MARAVSAAALVTAWGPVESVRAQGRDQIVPFTGQTAPGTILKMSPTEVEIDVRGAAKKFAVNEIDRLSFGDEPQDVRNGKARAHDGQYEEALALLNRTAEAISNTMIQEDLEYYRAFAAARLALTGGGDKAASAKAMLDFIGARPASFHYYEATALTGDLAYAMGRYDVASTYYSKLGEAPWPDYQLRAKVLDAKSLMAQEKYAEAQRRYEQKGEATVDTAAATRQKVLARIGRAKCLAMQGKPDEGQPEVESIIRDNDPQDIELFARAYNALGVCHSKANRPKDALLAFLHTDLLFAADADAHAESLFYLSELWTVAGKSDRAVDARTLLKSRYAGSVWAGKGALP